MPDAASEDGIVVAVKAYVRNTNPFTAQVYEESTSTTFTLRGQVTLSPQGSGQEEYVSNKQSNFKFE